MQYIQEKCVLITGVSKGLGKALARQLLDAGATVIGWGLNHPNYSHEQLHFIACDVSDPEQVEKAMAESLKISPAFHFLVNNAGFGFFSPIENFPEFQFRRMWEVNVYGAFLVTKAVVPIMKQLKAGHILNVSSIAGRVGMAQGEGYNSSKFALSGMSESLFHELRKAGIKVTTIYPGSIQTNFFDEVPGIDPHNNMLDPDEVATMMVQVMNTSPNFLVRELEVRPLNSKPGK